MTIEHGEWAYDIDKPKNTSYIKDGIRIDIRYTIEHGPGVLAFSKRLVTHTTYNGHETLQEAQTAKATGLKTRGDAKVEAKDYRGALQDYAAAARIAPKTALYRYNMAFAFYRLGCYDEAIMGLSRIKSFRQFFKNGTV